MQRKLFILLALFLACFHSHAQELKPELTLTTAQKILAGCIAYADSNKLGMAIAIYDNHGQLVNFAKMDGASLGAAKIAQWKGLSAATYRYPTAETAKWNVPTAPDLATIPGGLPITTTEGAPLGGLGVSGAAPAVDVACAEAGLRAAGLLRAAKKE